MLLEHCTDRMDDKGRDCLSRIRASTLRMAQLIDDLLSLSRVTRTEIKLEDLDLSGLAGSVLEGLKRSDPERQVEFVAQEGVKANGDARLLKIALENLLGNAWKFTSKHPKARIEFGSTEEEGKRVYFVRDDGAGFDMEYADKLFGAFQRLHNQSEFTGTGIGLSIVHRIIHRHGGRIWAQSGVEKGTTFYFTL